LHNNEKNRKIIEIFDLEKFLRFFHFFNHYYFKLKFAAFSSIPTNPWITLSNMHIIHTHLSQNPLEKLYFHLEIIRYLLHKDVIEPPLTLKHYTDWVPEKKKELEEEKNKEEPLLSVKKDFRLKCKYKNCKKKADLHCIGCSTNNFTCPLCT